ncbi:hypothetical protein AOQ84DRAFT_426968 [Glonium stellatum]|uniref:Glycoside hydrolase 131 catalytic N-terminal domain-containing protein n=1 Tax=Glonium stellatum TaxID=574774 RepID=A0A8E2JUS5_9PEZI|nr:hypothetical protein AOQ84DRAFT_426968 [Glonium stellatum]
MFSYIPLINTFLPFLLTLVYAQDIKCPITFDGRIPKNATKALFSSSKSPFNPKYVLGQNVTWDQVITFPDVPPSRFDRLVGGKAVEIKINDSSVFASTSEGAETALRRAELLVNNNNPTVSGIKNWHLSVRTSPERPLNYSHEYVLAWHESQDFQADFWSLKTGTPMGSLANDTYNSPVANKSTKGNGRKELYIQGYKWANPVQTFFSTPFLEDTWHNFGIHLDYDNNLIQILYSTGDLPLQIVTPLSSTNLSGIPPTTLGETHFGLQKRPFGANLTSFLYHGTQEVGIHEGIVYGGIWQEDSKVTSCANCTGCYTK